MGTRVVSRTTASTSTNRLQVAVTAKQVLEGKVLMVSRTVPHPKYKKLMKKTQKFTFHDEENVCEVGETVRVTSCRPLSKSKHFTLLEKVVQR